MFQSKFVLRFQPQFQLKSFSTVPNIASDRRLCKVIALSGICSRREAEKWIKEGRVSIDGTICKSPTYIISQLESDSLNTKQTLLETCKNSRLQNYPNITIDGVRLRWGYKVSDNAPKIWAISKLKGEIVASQDPQKSRSLLLERFQSMLSPEELLKHNSIKPIYRLEYETEGLSLLTNSGDLAKALVSDPQKFPLRYRVRVHGLITESKLSGLRKGLFVDGVKYRPMDVAVQKSSGTITWLDVTCYENKNKLIRNAFAKLYLDVTRLICVGFGPYNKEDYLPTGSGSEKGFAVVKLTPLISAMYHEIQNNKIVNSRSIVKQS